MTLQNISRNLKGLFGGSFRSWAAITLYWSAALFFLFTLCSEACHGQEVHPQQFLREGYKTVPFHILPDSASHAWIDARWKKVQECSGRSYWDKSPYKIKWFVREPIPVGRDTILGEFAEPDSIFLTIGYLDEKWVVEHELLHYLLPSDHGRGHSVNGSPFWHPCRLMSVQQQEIVDSTSAVLSNPNGLQVRP